MNDRPVFITHPANTWSAEHQYNCLGWWLYQQPEKVQAAVLDKQRPPLRAQTEAALLRCKAWEWLTSYDKRDIRNRLAFMPAQERDPLRAALNEVDAQIKYVSQQEQIA